MRGHDGGLRFPRRTAVRQRAAVLWRIVQPFFRWRSVISRLPLVTFSKSSLGIVPADATIKANDHGGSLAWLS